MTTFRDSIPTFLNGISQQNAALRENNLLDDAVNWEFLPSEGLTKRYPTEFVSELRTFDGDPLDLTGAHFVAMERDDQDYLLAFYDDTVNFQGGKFAVWDAQGNPVEVVNDIGGFENQFDYIHSTPSEMIRTQQVADALYVVNRARQVIGAPGTPEDPWALEHPGAGMAIKQSANNLDYSVTVQTEGMAQPHTITYRTPSSTTHNPGFTALALGSSAVPGSPNDANILSRGFFFFHEFLVARDTAEPYSSGWQNTVSPSSITDLRFYYRAGAISAAPSGTTRTEIPRSDFVFDSFTGACAYTGSDASALNADYWIIEQVNATDLQRGVAPNDVIRQFMLSLRDYFDGSSPERPEVRIEGNHIGPLNDKDDFEWSPTLDTSSNAIYVYFETPTSADDPIETWTVNDGEGGDFSSGWQKEIEGITDLPVFWKNGAVVKLTGNSVGKADDEYVGFTIAGATSGTFGRGVWRETVARGLPDGAFERDTMPHLIRREPDGSGGFRFRMGYGPWVGRSVGDSDSSEEPSFVGERILDVFWHENRLGLLAGPHLIMSESGNANNFWRTTLNALTDADPIDVTLTNLDGDTAFNGVPYDGSLMVFAEQAQTRISSEGPLSINSIEAPVVAGFRCSGVVRPVVSGRSLFFAYTTGDFTQIRQLIPGQYRADFQDAQTTIAVDKLIPNTTRKLIPNHTSDALVVLTDDRSQLFVHQYLQTSRESMMSAWGRWEFPGSNVEDVLPIGDRLFMPMVRDGKTYLESLLFGAGRGDQLNDFKPRLDRLSPAENATYDRSTDSTTWDVPFSFTADDEISLVAADGTVLRFGAPMTVTSSDPVASTVTAPGDLRRQPMLVGVPFNAEIKLSKPVLKQPSYRGGMFAPVGGRQIVRDIIFTVADTGYLRGSVDVLAGAPSTEEFLAYNDNTGALVESATRNGEFRIPIYAEVDEFRLTVSNPTPLPSTLVSGAWTIRYNQKKANR